MTIKSNDSAGQIFLHGISLNIPARSPDATLDLSFSPSLPPFLSLVDKISQYSPKGTKL